MKRVLATIAVGGHAAAIHAVTGRRMEAYARLIGAEYRVLRQTRRTPPHFAKFDVLIAAADQGVEQFLYVDADVYIRQNAPDIFEHYTSAAFNEIPHPRPAWAAKAIRWINAHLAPWPADRYFNTGVLVFDGPQLQLLGGRLRDARPLPGVYYEQDQLNVLMRDVDFPRQPLAQRWNQCCAKEWITPAKAEAAYFLHGNGVGQAEKLPLIEKFAREYP